MGLKKFKTESLDLPNGIDLYQQTYEKDALPDGVLVLKLSVFSDDQGGWFKEALRVNSEREVISLKEVGVGFNIKQSNESFSKKGVIRGLHFQWNPYMGKLVRIISGHMVDIVLDIRKGSPTFGKALLYDMPNRHSENWSEWIWVPEGLAHGNFFLEDSFIEYFCTGEYNSNCEASISPLSADIDWTMCDKDLKNKLDIIVNIPLISSKDKNGLTLNQWLRKKNSDKFKYEI